MNKKLISLLIVILFINAVALNAQFTKMIVSLTGTVTDEITKKPAAVPMEVFNEKGKKLTKVKSNKNTGYYFITGLNPGETYTIRIMDFDYLRQAFEIKIPMTDKYADFSRDLVVKPKAVGVKFKMDVSPFEIKKSNLRVGSDIFLSEINSSFRLNRRVKFVIKCYADSDENPEQNKVITEQRSMALKNYFTENGIDDDRITIESFDVTDPENPPPTKKQAKGKRYKGSVILEITGV